jgi:hypothetical protein
MARLVVDVRDILFIVARRYTVMHVDRINGKSLPADEPG